MALNYQDVVEMVKSYFENYEITEEDLRKPKPEFVINFYWDFLNEIEQHFNSVCRCEMKLFSLFKQEDSEMIMLKQLNDVSTPFDFV